MFLRFSDDGDFPSTYSYHEGVAEIAFHLDKMKNAFGAEAAMAIQNVLIGSEINDAVVYFLGCWTVGFSLPDYRLQRPAPRHRGSVRWQPPILRHNDCVGALMRFPEGSFNNTTIPVPKEVPEADREVTTYLVAMKRIIAALVQNHPELLLAVNDQIKPVHGHPTEYWEQAWMIIDMGIKYAALGIRCITEFPDICPLETETFPIPVKVHRSAECEAEYALYAQHQYTSDEHGSIEAMVESIVYDLSDLFDCSMEGYISLIQEQILAYDYSHRHG